MRIKTQTDKTQQFFLRLASIVCALCWKIKVEPEVQF